MKTIPTRALINFQKMIFPLRGLAFEPKRIH